MPSSEKSSLQGLHPSYLCENFYIRRECCQSLCLIVLFVVHLDSEEGITASVMESKV